MNGWIEETARGVRARGAGGRVRMYSPRPSVGRADARRGVREIGRPRAGEGFWVCVCVLTDMWSQPSYSNDF